MSRTYQINGRKAQLRDYRKMQLLRIEIIAKLYKRGYSYRQIRKEVMARLDLKAYSLQTVHGDVKKMLEEWRKERLVDVDEALQLELARIDEIVREAWAMWEKSKDDYDRVKKSQHGIPREGAGDGNGEGAVITTSLQQSSENVISTGDPRYLDIIMRNLAERRKLLGLYAPEKNIINGAITFTDLLMASSVEEISHGDKE